MVTKNCILQISAVFAEQMKDRTKKTRGRKRHSSSKFKDRTEISAEQSLELLLKCLNYTSFKWRYTLY